MTMIRMRGIIYVVIALLIVLFMVAFTSESFSLNSLLRPVPPSPRIGKVHTQNYNRDDVAADSPEVLRVLQGQYLIPPSKLPYNLSHPEEENPSMGQAQRIDFILKGKRNGFYVECGALDGEIRSNTLFFERERAWNGLLIEADPKNFNQMVQKHRKAYMSPSCLAPTSHPTVVMFQQQENQGHILGKQDSPSSGSEVGAVLEVQCFPLFSYLSALNVTTVDYFSLDVEGAEFSVLKTIPWEKVDIKTLSVEFIHDPEGKDAIQTYMMDKGYYVHSEVRHYNWLANDFIFVKNSVQ
ncbi:protein Star-like [Panulirus ornatus]|uniref:protein Star-like n=1 Tax=Panulirus ornatus TaxID=150431 RepID=UPI003A85E876